jgi:hypothetical protein
LASRRDNSTDSMARARFKIRGSLIILPGSNVLAAGGRTDDAIAILALDVEENAQSWNAYDRLGEVYMTAHGYLVSLSYHL